MSGIANSQLLTTKEVFSFMDIIASVEEEPDVITFRKAALHYLMGVFRAPHAAFYLTDLKNNLIDLDTGLGFGIDFGSLRTQYRQRFEKLDPFRQPPIEKTGVTLLSDMVLERTFMKGAFYNDFLKQQDILHALNIPLTANGDCVGAVTLCRAANEPNFTQNDKSRALRLLPYLDSTLRRLMTYEHANEHSWLLSTSLQELDHVGVILLDRDLNEVYSNATAQRLLSSVGSSSGSENSPVTGGHITLPAPLVSLCQQHFQMTYSDEGRDNEISSLIINSGQFLVRVKVRKMSDRFYGEQKQYLCLNIDTGEESASQIFLSRIAEFGLTKREIEIVQSIAKGNSNMQIAEDLFISCNTVKNHLKNIFVKVGVCNRVELLTTLLIRH